MKKKKVLQFSIVNARGGRTQVILNLWKSIDKELFQFDFITFNKSLDYEKELVDTGANIYHIENLPSNNLDGFISEFREILKNQYDIVHIATTQWNGTIIEELSREAGVKKIIVHAHSSGVEYNGVCDASVAKRHMTLRQGIDTNIATDYIACSEEAARWLYGDVIPPQKQQIVYNGVDTKKFKFDPNKRMKIRKELGVENKTVIGFVGRMVMVKNIDFIFRIFSILAKTEKYSLLLIGEGPLKEKYKNLSSTLGIEEQCVFSGFVTNVEEYLQAMDVFVLPSLFEGFPLVLLEAQCCGLNCLVSDSITKSANATGLVKYLSISDENIWINEIINSTSKSVRRDYSDIVAQKGFDIKAVASKIEKIYLRE